MMEPAAGIPRPARLAINVYREALEAVRADRLVREALRVSGGVLHAAGAAIPLCEIDRVLLVAVGKASASMASAAAEALGDALTGGVVIGKRHEGHADEPEPALPPALRRIDAGHPVPDDRSVEAGEAALAVAAGAGPRDLVICLLSGGASALMEAPAAGITLQDIQAATGALLRSGAAIGELNTVRACLSRVKAGGLARAVAPARGICLALSDVLGSPPAVIGSGPCVDVPVRPAEALRLLNERGVVDRLPAAVLAHLQRAASAPAAADTIAAMPYAIVGDIWTAVDAAREAALRAGLRPCVLTGSLQGEAREVAMALAGIARDAARTSRQGGIDCWIAGGETTVTVRGEGLGGRCQEIACVAAREIAGIGGVAMVAAGTDGTDGPTDAAGGLAHGGVLAAAEAAGQTAASALAASDTYRFLQAANALVKTGPTGSNVGDLAIIVHAPDD